MAPVMVPEDHADAEGPNASLETGDATKMADLQREAGTLATGGSAQAPQPGQTPAPEGQQSAPAGQPVQPSPSVTPLPSDRPDNTRVQPWMPNLTPKVNLDNLTAWRSYGPTLGMLAKLVDARRGRNQSE